MEPFIAQIILFAGKFAPKGWALCEGQLLTIANNTALFSVLGTTYGGDGQTTFALPDLRGRAPIMQGNGPGMPPVKLGERIEVSPLNLNHVKSNKQISGGTGNHTIQPSSAFGNDQLELQNDRSSGSASEQARVEVRQGYVKTPPALALNYIIALEGVFPSRN